LFYAICLAIIEKLSVECFPEWAAGTRKFLPEEVMHLALFCLEVEHKIREKKREQRQNEKNL
jgi:hypothetical protein